MLTFLRKIRRSMIGSGSAGKYLLYAIGEIALVVIGILIALQINNWNEKKKTDALELKLLQEVYYSLENSSFDFVIMQNSLANSSASIILNHFKKNLPYSDTLGSHFIRSTSWWSEELDKTAYETAKQYGLYFIKNDSARTKLSKLYEVEENILNELEKQQHDFHFSTSSVFLSENFERHNFSNNTILSPVDQSVFIPIDYEDLKKNKRFNYLIKTKQRGRENLISWQLRITNHIEQIKAHLKSEISQYQ